MSAGALIGLARQVGAPLVRDLLARRLGGENATLATDVAAAVARRAGVDVGSLEAVAATAPAAVEQAIREVEAHEAPELLRLYALEAEARVRLLEGKGEAPWKSAWRPGMMYVIGGLWIWALVGQPVIDTAGPAIAPVPLDTLFNLTLVYLSLYMGGHTVKAVATKLGAGRGT